MPEVITVTELNSLVKDLFAKTPTLNDIWVSGEISGLRKYPSGYYFVLKDPSSEIHAVMFTYARGRIDFEPQENMKVRAFGSIGMYVPRGTYQFIVETMAKSGIGDRYMAFEALKKKLGEEGLFDASHKRPIPQYPKTIGVVTSQSGAVIHDIITTSASRYTADILLAPAMVQGDGAAQSIVAGIETLNRAGVDVIIVGRGGGSIEDLWAFNEEIVARAIYNSKAPVVSAVGHETDFTIADFVADLRAPTPTGAAALILRDKAEISAQIESLGSRMQRAMSSTIGNMRHSFEVLDSKLDPRRALDELGMHSIHLDDLSRSASHSLSSTLNEMRVRFITVDSRLQPSRALDDVHAMGDTVEASLERIRTDTLAILDRSNDRLDRVGDLPEKGIDTILQSKETALASDSRQLEGLNPLNVLSRGYAMITSSDGKVVTTAEGLEKGEEVGIHLRDGTAKATIKSKEMKR